jgi:hypothetical protein
LQRAHQGNEKSKRDYERTQAAVKQQPKVNFPTVASRSCEVAVAIIASKAIILLNSGAVLPIYSVALHLGWLPPSGYVPPTSRQARRPSANGEVLDAPRFSFVRPDLLQEVLALTPGSATPFGLINDTQRCVTVILDEEVLDSEWVSFHPLHNAASTTLRSSDLLRSSAHSAMSRLLCDFRWNRRTNRESPTTR